MKSAHAVLVTAVTSAFVSFPLLASTVFDDATAWYHGACDANGNGSFDKGDIRDAFHVDPEHAWNNLSVEGSSTNALIVSEDVVYPYAAVTNRESCLKLVQHSQIVSASRTNVLTTALLLPPLFTVTNSLDYSLVFRFRIDKPFLPEDKNGYLVNFGYTYNGYSGFLLGYKPLSRISKVDSTACPDACGLTFYSRRAGSYDLYDQSMTNKLYCLTPGRWVDLALTLKNKELTVYYIGEGGRMKTLTKTIPVQEGDYGTSTLKLGCEKGTTSWKNKTESGYPNGCCATFNQFAVWQRALSEMEIRRAMAWPREDVLQIGGANDSVDEFAGTTSEKITIDNVYAPSAWKDFPAAFSSSCSETTIGFSLNDNLSGLPQVLRVRGTSNSADGKFDVIVNGTALSETLSVVRSQTGSVFVPGNLLVAGANELRLSLKNAGSDVVLIDALALGGSWRLGRANDSNAEFGSEANTTSSADVTESYLKCVRGALKKAYPSVHLGTWIPQELAEDYRFVLSMRYKPELAQSGTTEQVFDINVNDKTVSRHPHAKGGWQTISSPKFEAELFSAGSNRVSFVIEADPPPTARWNYIDYYQLTVEKKQSGFMMLVR